MEKDEVLLFLEELRKNELISSKYKKKLKEVSDYITSLSVADSMEDLSIKRNDYFKDGDTYTVYTDGGCLVNPGGNGGYGIVIIHNEEEQVFSKGFVSTTNNRMELRGPIEALKHIPAGSNICFYSDSKYFCNAINEKWLDSWLQNNWKNGTIKNIDLWKEFVPLFNKHYIEVNWVKGHADNEYNEKCDKLATEAYLDTDNLEIDKGYND